MDSFTPLRVSVEDLPNYLSPTQLAALAGIHHSKVYAAIKAGQIDVHKFGRTFVITRKEAERVLRQGI